MLRLVPPTPKPTQLQARLEACERQLVELQEQFAALPRVHITRMRGRSAQAFFDGIAVRFALVLVAGLTVAFAIVGLLVLRRIH